jgi:hypothetical protein
VRLSTDKVTLPRYFQLTRLHSLLTSTEQTMALTLNDSSLLQGNAYITGQWIAADSGETLGVENPATATTPSPI